MKPKFANVCFDCGEEANCFYDDGNGARWICKKHMDEALETIAELIRKSQRRSAEIIVPEKKDG